MEEIKKVVSKGDLSQAISLLHEEELSNQQKKNLQIIQFRYKDYLDSKQKGILTRQEEVVEINRIAESLVSLIDTRKVQEKSNKKSFNPNKKKKIILLIFTLLLIFSFLYYRLFYIKKNYEEYNFCVVAKSFSIYSNAFEYKQSLVETGYRNAKIIRKRNGEMYLTCYSVFSKEGEAILELEKIKLNNDDDEIWIYEY